MFEVIPFTVCIFLTGQCLELEDLRGPYSTEEACEIRISEMVMGARAVYTPRYGPVTANPKGCRPAGLLL